MEKIALVLEGGGLRGIYTAGVLDALLEAELLFPYVIGVSAGACNAASYISRQRGRSGRVLLDHVMDPRYLGFGNLLRYGSLFGMDFLFDEIPNRLDPFDYDTFFENDTEFEIPVTNLRTGGADYYCKDDLRDEKLTLLRATSSIPLVSRVVPFRGQPYLDGAIADSIPVRRALERGCTRCVVVLTQPRGFVKQPMGGRTLHRLHYRKYPAFLKTAERRHTVYNEALRFVEELERQGRALVLAPKEAAPFSAYEKSLPKLRAFYEAGLGDVAATAERIRTFLECT